jgi:hypothetical protein
MTLSTKQIASLKALTKDYPEFKKVNGDWEWVERKVSPTIYVRDNEVIIDCEDGLAWGDYYCEFGEEIDPVLTQWAAKNSVMLEWYNAGALIAYKA